MAITPTDFANRWIEQVLAPAATQLSGRDGKLSVSESQRWPSKLEGNARLAGDNLADVFQTIEARTPRLQTFIEAARAYAEAKAKAAADPDGLIRDRARLELQLRADFELLDPPPAPPPERPYTFSQRVLESVMAEFGLADADALIEASKRHDNGNHRLTRAELTAGAIALTAGGPPELGIVSDLDQTIIPKHDGALPARAYAGVATLIRTLEFGGHGVAGDVYYVTARAPDRVLDVPAWLDDHGLPGGPIDTGTSSVPWVAQREKVSDITRILEAHPQQSFVFFGDTAHRDPEVYRQVQDRFPNQVRAVFLHAVTANIPPERVAGMTLIQNYAEAAAHLYQQRLLSEAEARDVINAARQEGLELSVPELEALLAAHAP